MLDQKYKNFIPLDKSWIIRMGILDIVHGHDDIIKFLDNQPTLSDDLIALKRASEQWKTQQVLDVGESGTLFRLLQFTSWKLGLNKTFIKQGTLKDREITNDPQITTWGLSKLLELDNGTSQWASASILLGNPERIENPPYKLLVTYQAVEHWNKQRAENKSWEPRYDQTITNQAESFLRMLNGQPAEFKPEQAEDYCFARTFDLMTPGEGDKLWPSLKGHESNRIEEMEEVITRAEQGQSIESRDHRAVQAIAMWGIINQKSISFTHPQAVAKSWPQFWDFLKAVTDNN